MLIFKLNLVILFQHILLGKFGVLDKGLGNLRVFFYLVFISEKVVKNLRAPKNMYCSRLVLCDSNKNTSM